MSTMVGCLPALGDCFLMGSLQAADLGPDDLNILVAGNPGCGKSTFLNCLMGKRGFKSGLSYGSGMTYELDKVKSKNEKYCFLDTPGLNDEEKREQAAQAITRALKQNGRYLILFMTTLENGRVKPEDIATMKLVLDAAPSITSYGIIVNQLGCKEWRELQSNENPRDPTQRPAEMVRAMLLKALPRKTSHILYMRSFLCLASQSNRAIRLPPDVLKWVQDVPRVHIDAGDVQAVQFDQFEKIKKEHGQQIRKLLADREEMEKQMNLMKQELEEIRLKEIEADRQRKQQLRREEEEIKRSREEEERKKKDAEAALKADVKSTNGFLIYNQSREPVDLVVFSAANPFQFWAHYECRLGPNQHKKVEGIFNAYEVRIRGVSTKCLVHHKYSWNGYSIECFTV